VRNTIHQQYSNNISLKKGFPIVFAVDDLSGL
jgi:hypothetical protein